MYNTHFGYSDSYRIRLRFSNKFGGTDTCSKSWYIEFKDTKDDGYQHWYWTEIRGYKGTTQSRAVRLYNPTGSGTCTLRVNANYFDFSSPEPYAEIFIGSCETSHDAANHKATRGYGQLQGLVSIPGFGSNCWQRCCTDKYLDEGWYWVTGKRADTSDGGCIVEAKSYIKSTYGSLCGESINSTHPAHQVAYVNISRENPLYTIDVWVQTGFFRHRFDGETSVTFGRYSEIGKVGVVFWQLWDSLYHGAFEGEQRIYQMRLANKSTGYWEFYDNGMLWDTATFSYWAGKTGNTVQFTGEIYSYETDMPGTATNRCKLDICTYRTEGDSVWNDANFLVLDDLLELGSSDLSHWPVNPTSQATIQIWDNYPQ